MPLRTDLLNEISARLAAITTLNLSSSSAACDIFEAYIFALVLEAAMNEGANISFENISGMATTNLVFRTSPGRIYSAQPPTVTPPYTHAIISFPDTPQIELHQGIYISGRSDQVHECDIAAILRSEGVTCRNERVIPRSAKMVLAVECKFYSTGLSIDLGRSFVGLTTDLRNEDRFFISNTTSASITGLLTHHKRKWAMNAVPANDHEIVKIRSSFETAFSEFKARHQ